MLNNIFNEYPHEKTIICIQELCLPSKRSRAKGIPRPQNLFLLFRRNVSRGLYNANIACSVSASSRIASSMWKSLTSTEQMFWQKIFEIAKRKHINDYPKYNISKAQTESTQPSVFETKMNCLKVEIPTSTTKQL
ncbi:5549_t:CDS:2 [Funneliformis caledonium]|uniref:5549_t:CDS:1 n=1 Tax=Funneliformis caledonium TaxID=1117310 RepID=A0A9N9GES4_9GLOM|nr:5549_t:CDS:2 [Funneliformis caledonium]